MPWPPSAVKRSPPGPAGLAKNPVTEAFGLIDGFTSAGKKAKKFMLIAARFPVIARSSSRLVVLAQSGGVKE